MQLAMYESAVNELAIPKLTDFLKANSDIIEISGWSGMKAPEKRGALMEGFGMSAELRKAFVAYYEDVTEVSSDWSEWEQGDLPDVPGLDTDVEETLPVPADTPAPQIAGATQPQYVEGAFATIVSDVAGLNAEDSNAALIAIEDNLGFEHIRMGVLLGHIHKSQHYVQLGYENMRAYLAANTNLHYRKAMILVANAQTIRELGITAEEMKGVSWSALRHIAPILNSKNYKEWLDMARSTTHVALIEAVRSAKAENAEALPAPEADAEKPKMMNKLFSLHPDQKATVDAALEKAKAEGNVDSTGAALDIIASAYTGAPPSGATVGAAMPDLTADGMATYVTALKADQGLEGLVALLNIIGDIFPKVDIDVKLPKGNAEAA